MKNDTEDMNKSKLLMSCSCSFFFIYGFYFVYAVMSTEFANTDKGLLKYEVRGKHDVFIFFDKKIKCISITYLVALSEWLYKLFFKEPLAFSHIL